MPSAILSTQNLIHNVNVIRSVAKKSKLMVMLKANAYGHGIRSTAMRLDTFVEYLGVARIDEAIALRKVGIRARICIMQGVYTKDDVMSAACNDFELVLHDRSQLHSLDMKTPKKVNIWLKINTGIGRLGFEPNECQSIFQKIKSFLTFNRKNRLP